MNAPCCWLPWPSRLVRQDRRRRNQVSMASCRRAWNRLRSRNLAAMVVLGADHEYVVRPRHLDHERGRQRFR